MTCVSESSLGKSSGRHWFPFVNIYAIIDPKKAFNRVNLLKQVLMEAT